MSVVFIGTPQFAVPSLRRLVADGHTISAVVTQPDRPAGRGRQLRPSPVKLVAEELGIPIQLPPTLRDPEAVARIALLKPKVLVAVAYGQILRQEVLDIAPLGILNIHPSLLPRWRGASPIPTTILAGDSDTGVSIILMDAGMDSGPVLAQQRVTINPSQNTASLTEQLSHLGADLLAHTLARWLNGEIEPQPQDESQATVCPLLRKEDGAIDWTKSAVEIWRQIRAYNPWPGAYTTLGGDLLRIWEAWPLEQDVGRAPGLILSLSREQQAMLPPEAGLEGRIDKLVAFTVQTGRGLLVLVRVQRAGRRPLGAGEFLRGMPDLIGKRLGFP